MDPATADPALLSCYVLLMLGFALAIIVPDRNTPTTRALAAAMALSVTWTSPYLLIRALDLTPLAQAWPVELVPAEFAQIAVAEWFLRVLRTAPRDAGTDAARIMLRTVQWIQPVAIFFRIKYAAEYDHAIGLLDPVGAAPEFITHMLFYLELLSDLLLPVAMTIMLLRRTDVAERLRVISIGCALPFFFASDLFMEQPAAWIALRTLGVLVGLAGVVQYLFSLGQRGEFLARFLSPQVRAQVRAQGLMQALDTTQIELTVVCCDLRGFTAYSKAQPSKQVAGLLQHYFAAVSAAATQYGCTIKDFAGDGVGVASGVVTVGAIDAASRLEYMAVGPAVNLATRLCSLAVDGDILVSDRTAELAGTVDLAPRAPIAIKGFGDSIPHFSAEPAPTPA